MLPDISVLMPVYNAENYLAEAIDSIVTQSFRNFEFIIIDDASNDGSAGIVRRYSDERIVFIQNEVNLGVAETLNKGVGLARGKYIVRMDADDISVPQRLERQIKYMEANPEVGISGGWIKLFGIGPASILRVPGEFQEIAAYMLFDTPMCHVTVIMRRELLEKYDLQYNPSFSRSEDYDLWTRAIEHCAITNLGEVLVHVRQHNDSVTLSNWDEVTTQTEIISNRMLGRVGVKATKEETAFHHRVGRGYRMQSRADIEKAEKWLAKLCAENDESKNIHEPAFQRVVAMVWLRVCANSGPLGPWIFRKWHSSPIAKGNPQPINTVIRFVVSIVYHQCLALLRKLQVVPQSLR